MSSPKPYHARTNEELRASLSDEQRPGSAKDLQQKIEEKIRREASDRGGGSSGRSSFVRGLFGSGRASNEEPRRTSGGGGTGRYASRNPTRSNESPAVAWPEPTRLAANTGGSTRRMTPEERLQEKIARDSFERRQISGGRDAHDTTTANTRTAYTRSGSGRAQPSPEDRMREEFAQSGDGGTAEPPAPQGEGGGSFYNSCFGTSAAVAAREKLEKEKSKAGVGAFPVTPVPIIHATSNSYEDPEDGETQLPYHLEGAEPHLDGDEDEEQPPPPSEESPVDAEVRTSVRSSNHASVRSSNHSEREPIDLVCGMKKKVFIGVVVAFVVVIIAAGAAVGAAVGVATSRSSSPSNEQQSDETTNVETSQGTETSGPSPAVPDVPDVPDVPAVPPGCTPDITELPRETDLSDSFGADVAISRRTAVVGAPSCDSCSGSAFVYERVDGDEWVQTAELRPSEQKGGDLFGKAVAIDDDIIVVGGNCLEAIGEDTSEFMLGCAWVYIRTGILWLEEAKLVGDDVINIPDVSFANSIAIDDGTVVIGEPLGEFHERGMQSGSVYIFQRKGDGTWNQDAKIQPSDGQDRDSFGSAVDIDEGQVVIGAHRRGSGAAYVYTRQLDGSWVEQKKLVPSDGASSDAFGRSVGITWDVIAVGAGGDDDNGFSSGSVYVYKNNGSGEWKETDKLVPDDGMASDKFGSSIAVDSDIIVVGAVGVDDEGEDSGAVYVFSYDRAQSTWLQTNKISPADGRDEDEFGSSVNVYYPFAIVGSFQSEQGGGFGDGATGSAHVIELC